MGKAICRRCGGEFRCEKMSWFSHIKGLACPTCAEEIRKLESERLRHERELKRYREERQQELERERVRYEHERERDRMRHKHERGIAEMRAWVDHNRTSITFTPDGGISIDGPSEMFQGFLSQRGLPYRQQKPPSNWWRQRGLPYKVEEPDDESDEESDEESDDDEY